MGKLQNNIPQLLKEREMSTREFVGRCMTEPQPMSHDTAYRLAAGETNFGADKFVKAALVLGVDIGDVIKISNGSH